MPAHSPQHLILELQPDVAFLPAAVAAAENAAQVYGLDQTGALKLALAVEEFFTYLCRFAGREEPLRLTLSPGGSFVRVGFAVGSSPQLRVPQSAVVDRAGMTGVFVVDKDGIAHFRLVRLGAQMGADVEIQAGLNPDDTIVTSNLPEVENGVKIGGGNRG